MDGSTRDGPRVIPPAMDQMTRGERIRFARKRNGWGQQRVAAAIEKSIEQYARYEKDTAVPDFPTGLALCRALGCTPEWLEYGEGLGPQEKHRVLGEFLKAEGAGFQPELKTWLSSVPPSPIVAYDWEFLRGLVSAWYRGERRAQQASDAAAIGVRVRRSKKTKPN